MNEKQLNLISHSLGCSIEIALRSNRKKDRELPSEYYRNYFCAGSLKTKVEDKRSDWLELEKMVLSGLAIKYNKFDNVIFKITEKGILEFEKEFTKKVIDTFVLPSKSKQEYADFEHSDSGLEFSEWLGIQLPEYENSGSCWSGLYYGEHGLVRMVSTKYRSVKGEYCKNRKLAKASYKLALKEYKSLEKAG